MVNLVSKVALKLELKYNEEDKEKIEELFKRSSKIIDTAHRIIHNLYPLRAKPKLSNNRYVYANSKELKGYLIKLYQKNGYYAQYAKGISSIVYNILDIMHNNAEGSYHARSLPDFEHLKEVLPVRISKMTPSWSKESDKNQIKAYDRDGRFIIKDNKLYFKLKDTMFYVATKLNKEKFQLLADSIHGNGITIGDPCLLVRKISNKGKHKGKPRYFLHVSISKPKPKLETKSLEPLRVVGVDIGISDYLAVVSCVEYLGALGVKPLRIINAKGFKSNQFISLLDRYEESKRVRMSSIHKQEGVKKGQTFAKTNRKGDSLRVDYRRQIIHYIINRIIEFAKENKANIVVIEDLKGLHKEKNKLKEIKKFLGDLYNDINKHGLKALNIEVKGSPKTKELKQEILNHLKSINDKKKVLKEIIRVRRRLTRHIKLLSYLPYSKFEQELENELNWNGIILKKINASNTSITCIRCGNKDKHNRITRSLFKCSRCNFEIHADFIASINIALKELGSLTKVSLEDLIKLRGTRGIAPSTPYGVIGGVTPYAPIGQERASVTMTKHEHTSPLSHEPKAHEIGGVSRLTPAREPSNPRVIDEGVSRIERLTENNLSVMQGLVSLANEFAEQKGNGG